MSLLHELVHDLVVHVIDVHILLTVVKIVPNDSRPKHTGLDTRSKSASVLEAKLQSVYFLKWPMDLLYLLLLIFRFI